MYKQTEKQALKLLKRGIKTGAPIWLIAYCERLIDKAGYYRREADIEGADKKLGENWRQNRYTKAYAKAKQAVDVMEAFLQS